MKTIRLFCCTTLIGLLASIPVCSLQAATFQTLHSMSLSDSDYSVGANPMGGVIGIGNRLFGTTSGNDWFGTGYSLGTVFSVNRDGSDFQTLHQLAFNNPGEVSTAGLLNIGGTLYGMTTSGGSLFSVNTDGSNFQVLHAFDGSLSPASALTQINGTIYGTAYTGGSIPSTWITVYSINADGSGFQDLNSQNPSDPAILTAVGSSLYWQVGQVLRSMQADGSQYHLSDLAGDAFDGQGSRLLQVGAKLYGAGDHSVYSVNLDGSNPHVLHTFSDGERGIWHWSESGLTLIGDVLYGATSLGGIANKGTVFSLNLDGSNFQLLHSFNGSDGEQPIGQLTAIGSTLYGTTYSGGDNGEGTVFALTVPEPATWLLGIIGGIGAAAVARRSRQTRL